MRNWLDKLYPERATVNGSESQWALVTSGVKKRRLQGDLSVAFQYLEGA